MTKQTRFINPSNPKQGFDAITQLLRDMYKAAAGKPLRITVEVDEETRKNKQNNLLWKWHSEYIKFKFETTGEIIKNPKHWHHVWKGIYIGGEPVQVLGKWELIPKSSADLSVKNFALCLQKYEADAANEGCNFTRPQDLYIESIMRGAE